jgi:hypothetical protein
MNISQIMKNLRLNFILVSLSCIFITTSLSSCIVFLIVGPMVEHKAEKRITVESGAIPADFGKGDVTVLAILEGSNSYDRYMKKDFEKCYKGKYITITNEDLTSKKYNDVKKYRYVFNFVMETHGQTAQDSYGTPVRRFYILDRLDNKQYISTFTSGYFSRVMKGYLKNMDQARTESK